ncbi:SGNH/GDSL hydrolase family protein [Luteolibacter sp. AS25]|uniref:SGNH/GDSL hydrolase family protein n=1 Tax=Luteolibacter sp. AS25 TaxID=3135776 RepID=UPI00398AE89E
MTKRTRGHESIFRKLMILSRILCFLGLSSCVQYNSGAEKLAAVRGGEKRTRLNVLFIGNSYSFGVPEEFRRLATKNDKWVKVSSAAIGGWTLEKHMQTESTLNKLHSRKWDVVVIQDHSLHPGCPEPERCQIMDPGVKYFAGEARAMGAVPLLYQTWGRRDGNEKIPGDDFYQMNDRVRTGYRAASRNNGGIEIVPAGDAWEEVYRSGLGRELFHEDGSHPSDFGNRISARRFYEVIFDEKLSIIGE